MGSIPNVDQAKLESMPIDEVQVFSQSSQEWLKLSQKFLKSSREDDVKIDELIQDHREQSNLRKIESLEQKLINNLDESSYSELIKLKSQLNRE